MLSRGSGVKKEGKVKSKKRKRGAKDEGQALGEFAHQTLRRRTYNYRGRRGRLMVRPGVSLLYQPGVRSGPAYKRIYDEVMTSPRILEEAAARENEFAYGKRFLLDVGNPTPSMQTLIPQGPLSLPTASKRRVEPTVEVLMSKKGRMSESETPVSMWLPETAAPPTVKVRRIKQITPDLGIQPIDIEVPLQAAAPTAPEGPVVSDMDHSTPAPDDSMEVAQQRFQPPTRASVTPAQYRLHPSMVLSAPSSSSQPPRRLRRRRRRRRRTGAVRPPAFPQVRYHPSITPVAQARLPEVRYHPSISAPVAPMRLVSL